MTPAAPPSSPVSRPGRDASPPRWLYALLAAATLWHVAAFAWVVPNNDFIRDLLFALPIAEGGPWPLRGPPINDAGHLGPLWFLVVALPLALGGGLAATAWTVGTLSLLKVPLAYRLGTRLGGPALPGAWLGLVLAAAMLLPGWDRLHVIQLTHTVVLETMLLACMLPLLTLWRGGDARAWALFGGLSGLALHAHPLALGLLLPASIVAWRRRTRLRADVRGIAVGLVLAALPLVPMLYAEWRDGWPMFAMAQAKLDWTPPAARTPLHELVAAFVSAPWTVPRLLVPAAFAAIAVAGATLAVAVAAAGVPALLRDGRARRLAATIAGLLALALVVLVAVRYRTPFYMALAAWPGLMWLLALPLAALAGRGRGGRIAAATAVVAMVGAGSAMSLGWVAATRDGHAVLPLPSIIDVRHTDAPGVRLALMPLHAIDRLARARCASAPLHVHGELAALVDYYQRIPFRWRCPAMPVTLMGTGAGPHWAGMTPDALHRLGHVDADWSDAVALAPVRVIAPARGVDVVVEYRYPARDIVPGAAHEHRVAFDAGGTEAVAAYSPLFPYDGAGTPRATCGGVAVAPVSTTNAGALFVPPTREGCRWEIVVDSRVADQLDVITLPLRPSGSSR